MENFCKYGMQPAKPCQYIHMHLKNIANTISANILCLQSFVKSIALQVNILISRFFWKSGFVWNCLVIVLVKSQLSSAQIMTQKMGATSTTRARLARAMRQREILASQHSQQFSKSSSSSSSQHIVILIHRHKSKSIFIQ